MTHLSSHPPAQTWSTAGTGWGAQSSSSMALQPPTCRQRLPQAGTRTCVLSGRDKGQVPPCFPKSLCWKHS